MTCRDFKQLAHLNDDELDAATRTRLERHRAGCAECAQEYARLEAARRTVRALAERQPVLTDPLLLVNAVMGRIERDALAHASPLPASAFDRWLIRLSSPAIRTAMACALLLITGSFALEYTRGVIRMKTLEQSVEKISTLREQTQTAGLGQNDIASVASDVAKFISGRQGVLELSDTWVAMKRQSFAQFLLLYDDLKRDASSLPPDFRKANPELTKLLEAQQPSEQRAMAATDREELIRELNRLVSSER